MALFGLFDKKVCAVCGGEIGLLGNRKLEDGNLCKNCAARLSPWFSERRHSTVGEIMQQLAYREANYQRVLAFVPTRMFGDRHCLFMDDNMQAFTVTSPNGLTKENPDIVDYAAYVSVKPEIIEHRWEDHNAPHREGMPPRFRYDYDFYITIYVNHPYFDDMRFQLNSFSVKQTDWNECMRYVNMAEDIVEVMSGSRPELSYNIRPYEPEVIPTPQPIPMQGMRPMGSQVPPQARPTPQPAPQSRPTPQPAPQNRPAPQPMGQGRPVPQQSAPQSRPAPQPMGQGRPAPQQSAPQSRPAPQPMNQGRSTPQQSAPQSKPAAQPMGQGRSAPQQSAPQSRPTAQPMGQGRPAPQQSAPQSRPTAQPSNQGRPAPQQSAPQGRQAPQSMGQSKPASQPANQGRPAPQGNGPSGMNGAGRQGNHGPGRPINGGKR